MSQYDYKQLDDKHTDSPICNSFQSENIDVGPYVPASIAREIELKKAELERENAKLRELAKMVVLYASGEALPTTEEILARALDALPNVQAQR
jgi:hypothetical protein